MKEGYTDIENDIENIFKIINETGFSKAQIKNPLTKHHLFEYMDFDKDIVLSDSINPIFK